MEVNHRDFSLYACRLYYNDMKSYKSIGKIVSSFGLKGEVILQHVLGKKTSLKGLEVLFIENQKDEMLPYFIMSARIKSENELYLLLDGMDAKEKTKAIMQRQVWLAEEQFHYLDFVSLMIKMIWEKFLK